MSYEFPSLVDYVLKGFSFEEICVVYKELFEKDAKMLFRLYYNVKKQCGLISKE